VIAGFERVRRDSEARRFGGAQGADLHQVAVGVADEGQQWKIAAEGLEVVVEVEVHGAAFQNVDAIIAGALVLGGARGSENVAWGRLGRLRRRAHRGGGGRDRPGG
jgi:hypothetical protein